MKKISDAIPKLDKEKQNYILGVAEGMEIERGTCSDEEEQESA